MAKKTQEESPRKLSQRYQTLTDKKVWQKRFKKISKHTSRHTRENILSRIENLRGSRQVIIGWLLMCLLLIVSLIGQSILSAKGLETTGVSDGGSYIEGSVGEINTLNPLYATTSGEKSATKLMFSSLMYFDEMGSLHADLASGMSTDNSKKVYTVTLRQTAKWHDGKPVTANDVVFTMGLIQNPAARVPTSLSDSWQNVQIQKIDDFTVQFTLPTVYAAFPAALTFPIIPQHILADAEPAQIQENNFSLKPVGSGPFIPKRFENSDTTTKRDVLQLTANTNYFLGAPRIRAVELITYPDTESLSKALSRKELTAAVNATGSLEAPAGYNHLDVPVASGVYALFNVAKAPFSSQALRAALRQAIDTAAVRDSLGQDVNAMPLPILSSQVAGADDIPEPTFDRTAARKAIEKAGYTIMNGIYTKKGQPLTMSIAVISNPQYEKAANEIAQQLKEINVSASVMVYDTSKVGSDFSQTILRDHNFEMLVYELPIGGDPDVYAYWHSSQKTGDGYNFSGYSSAIADAALVSARDQPNQALRSAKYVTFAKQWLSDVPAIGLYQQAVTYISTNTSQTLTPDSELVSISDRFNRVQNWTVREQSVYKTP